MQPGFTNALVLFAALGAWAATPVHAESGGASDPAEASLADCYRAEEAPDSEKDELIVDGMRTAEAAVDVEPQNARAHLALFCNLGKQLERRGVGFSTLSTLRRLKREIDLAIELSPDDPDILAAKGAFLVELPSMFGGDVTEGEKLLRRSLAIDGENHRAREYLAKALEASGRYRLAELVRRAGVPAVPGALASTD